MNPKYYDISKLMKTNARYLICFGERSNGKTFQALLYAFTQYIKYGNRIGVIRRFREDFKGKRGGAYFDNLMYDGNGYNHVKKLTKGKFDKITYYAGRWYLAYYDVDLDKYITQDEPFAYAFALTETEHEKGNTYQIGTIIFDEFMTRNNYLPDEFVLFMNTISTIVRARTELNHQMIRIIMCANTVSQYCPYFDEMGLKHVRQMKPGDIEVYNYGESGLRVAVEYCDTSSRTGKASDVFFAFDNPKLKMITTGEWELDIYPHLREKHKDKDIRFSYFIKFDEHIIQADIVLKENMIYTFMHPKTTDIKYPDRDVVFTTDADQRMNYFGNLLRPANNAARKILYFFRNNKVFYSSNEIGEIVAQYLIWCNNN